MSRRAWSGDDDGDDLLDGAVVGGVADAVTFLTPAGIYHFLPPWAESPYFLHPPLKTILSLFFPPQLHALFRMAPSTHYYSPYGCN